MFSAISQKNADLRGVGNLTSSDNRGQVKVKQSHYRHGQAWTGPEGSRRLRFPDFMTVATRSQIYPPPPHQEIFLVLISVRGCVDPRAIVRLKDYVNEKFQ